MKKIILMYLSSSAEDRRAEILRMDRKRTNLYMYVLSKRSPESYPHSVRKCTLWNYGRLSQRVTSV